MNITPTDKKLLNCLFNIEHEKCFNNFSNTLLLSKQQIIENCKDRILRYIAMEKEGIFIITTVNQDATIVIKTTTKEIDIDLFKITISDSYNSFQVEEVLIPFHKINTNIVKHFENQK